MKKNRINLFLITGALLLEIVSIVFFDFTGECRLLAFSLTTGFLFLVSVILFIQGKTTRNLLIRLILNIKGEAGSWIGVLSVIFVILNLNWISDQIYDIWYLDTSDINYFSQLSISILRVFYFLCFTFLVFQLLLNKSQKKLKTEKLLVCGLSTPVNFTTDITEEIIQKKLREAYSRKEEANDFVQLDPSKTIRWGKWDVVRKSLIAHPSVTEIYIVISPEIVEFNRYRNNWKGTADEDLCHDFDIEQLIHRFFYDRTITVSYSPPIDVNDFDLVKNILGTTFSTKKYSNFSDSEIVFNLTGSTAIVSSAMILYAIKGERKAEYVNQNTRDLVSIDVDVLSVQDLWDEILFKVQEKYTK